MSNLADRSVLVLGGAGLVGAHALRALRKIAPRLPITIGARDTTKARALAAELRAEVLSFDLARADLGLPRNRSFHAIAALFRDDRLASLGYAQATRTPLVTFSDFNFDLTSTIAAISRAPEAAPVVNLSTLLGGTVLLATLHHARRLRMVERIAIGTLLDEDDAGGPEAQGDGDRLERAVPHALIREDGRFRFALGDEAKRTIVDRHGRAWEGRALPLLDVPSLAAATNADSVRIDLAIRPRSERAAGEGVSVEVVVNLEGERDDGTAARLAFTMRDESVHARASGYGLALALERLSRSAGALPPGFHPAEKLLDPEETVQRLGALGVNIAQH